MQKRLFCIPILVFRPVCMQNMAILHTLTNYLNKRWMMRAIAPSPVTLHAVPKLSIAM